MTIIAYKAGIMAADSGMWNEGRKIGVPFPKIVRGADGSLWAMAGKIHNAWYLRDWVQSGMDHANPPPFDHENREDYPCVIWVKPDGSIWSAHGEWRFGFMGANGTPEATGCWGEPNAATFCEGAMMAGLSAAEAVTLTITHHQWAGGKVQIEALDPMKIASRAAVPDGWPPGQETRGMSRERAWAAYQAKHGRDE